MKRINQTTNRLHSIALDKLLELVDNLTTVIMLYVNIG